MSSSGIPRRSSGSRADTLGFTRRDGGFLALAALARVFLDLSELLAHPLKFKQWEEAYNASVARFLWHTGLWGDLLHLQYKAFCGGCSVVSTLAAPVLGLGGDHFLVWKSVALSWTVAELVVGFFALDRHVGRAAGWAWVVLWMVPPTGVSDLALMLWGNHQESTLFVLLALALVDRPFLAGFFAAFGVWFCRTATYGAVALLPLLLFRRGRRDVVLGALLGLAPFLFQSAVGDVGPNRIHVEGNVFPAGWAGVLARAGYLFGPTELAWRQFIGRADSAWLSAIALGAAAVAALLCVWRARLALWIVLVWIVAFTGTGVPIYLMRLETPVTNARYHAPWLFLLVWIAAAGVGVAWSAGWRRWSGVLLVVAVFPGLYSQVDRLRSWTYRDLAARLQGGSDPILLLYAPGRLDDASYLVTPTDAWAAETMGILRGVHLGRDVLLGLRTLDVALDAARTDTVPVPCLRGLGHALANTLSPEAMTTLLAGLPTADADALAIGYALDLGFRRPRAPGDPTLVVGNILASLPEGVDPRLRAAAGPALAAACMPANDAPTLARCLLAGSTDPGILRLAGVASARPDRDPLLLEEVADQLPAEAGAAFRAGARDLLAGLGSAFEGPRIGVPQRPPPPPPR